MQIGGRKNHIPHTDPFQKKKKTQHQYLKNSKKVRKLMFLNEKNQKITRNFSVCRVIRVFVKIRRFRNLKLICHLPRS